MATLIKNLSISILLTFIAVVGPTYAQESTNEHSGLIESMLSRDVLAEGDQIIKSLVSKYPPQKHVYVFVGRSLSVIQLQMEAKGFSTENLPISGKEFHPEAPSKAMQILTNKTLEIVDKHLGHLTSSTKRIVLVDYSASGQGIKAAKKLLNYFFQDQKKIVSFEVMIRDFVSNTKAFKRFFEKDHIYRLKEDSRLSLYLLASNFDFLAPYASFVMSSGHYKDHTSPRNDDYRVAAKAWISGAKLKYLQCSAFLN